jgi:predicted transcriptional regulator
MKRRELSGIGTLEAEILGVVKQNGELSASQVLDTIHGRPIAYTTVSTTLDRLHKKGLLKRKSVIGRGGARYVYSYSGGAASEREIVNSVVDRLVNAFGTSAVSAIMDRLDSSSANDLEDLKKGLAKKEEES